MKEDPSSSSRMFVSSRANAVPKPSRGGDDLVELLWENGQIVMQSQNNSNNYGGDRALPKKPSLFVPPNHQIIDQDLWIQEDEMASWLHCPLDCDANLGPAIAAAAPPPQLQLAAEATVVDSSSTPRVAAARPAAELGNCEVAATATETASSGGSEEQVEAGREASGERKRKGREEAEEEEEDWHSEDAGLDYSAITKKNVHVPTTVRRSRAAEVHNLSERKRRDRINEKMKALQELIPRCNKSDKASMLDEAIEYLKSLQLQVQMMSMGSCMMPFGFPGVQQYMSPMLMGMGMGMGMGMDAGLSHQMLPFPPVLAGPSVPNPAAMMHLSSQIPVAAFHRPPVSSTDSATNPATGQMDNGLNSSHAQNPSTPQFPNFADRYPHILALHPMQVPPCPPRPSMPNQGTFAVENQTMPPPNTSKRVDSLESSKSR